jgi:hypothetical protein
MRGVSIVDFFNFSLFSLHDDVLLFRSQYAPAITAGMGSVGRFPGNTEVSHEGASSDRGGVARRCVFGGRFG